MSQIDGRFQLNLDYTLGILSKSISPLYSDDEIQYDVAISRALVVPVLPIVLIGIVEGVALNSLRLIAKFFEASVDVAAYYWSVWQSDPPQPPANPPLQPHPSLVTPGSPAQAASPHQTDESDSENPLTPFGSDGESDEKDPDGERVGSIPASSPPYSSFQEQPETGSINLPLMLRSESGPPSMEDGDERRTEQLPSPSTSREAERTIEQPAPPPVEKTIGRIQKHTTNIFIWLSLILFAVSLQKYSIDAQKQT